MEFILNWMGENPVIVIIILVVLFLIYTYNNLNSRKKRVEKSFSTIDVYLEKRWDEIGALLQQLEVAYKHEESTFTQISALRSGIELAKNGSINDKINAVNGVSNLLAMPGIKTEAYPQLEAISNLGMNTMKRTSEVEDDIAAARLQYNSNATSYNIKISSFPSNMLAGIFGFKVPFELFKVDPAKKERPVLSSMGSITSGKNREE